MMILKILLTFSAVVFGTIIFLTTPIIGQTSEIGVTFSIAGKALSVRKFEVFVSDPENTLNITKLKRKGNKIFTTREIRNKESLNIRIAFNGYDLNFYDVSTTLFSSEWNVGIKLPPFEEVDEVVPNQVSNKRLTMVYFIAFHPSGAEGRVQKINVYQ